MTGMEQNFLIFLCHRGDRHSIVPDAPWRETNVDETMSEVPTSPKRRYRTDRESMERESEVDFMRASGPGGQHRNRRETGVRVTHFPSGVRVQATERRSQHQNLDIAFERLAERLHKLNQPPPKKRKKTKPSRAANRRRIEAKKKRGAVKKLRRKPID